MNTVIDTSSILGQAAQCITDAISAGRITLDEETLADVTYTLDRVLRDESEGTTHMDATLLQPWAGDNGDVDGHLAWALETFRLELSERADDLNTVLDGGRLSRIGEAHKVFVQLLVQR